MDVIFDHSLPHFAASDASSASPPSPNQASPASNYLGALLFWSYIGAALYFLWDITRTLLALRKFALYRRYAYSRPGVAFFGACAVLSFAILSQHMLNVLIESYAGWAWGQGMPVPGSLTEALGAVLASPLSGGGDDARDYGLPANLWRWSVSSTLFRDFAHAITATGARWAWAQADLGVTLVTAYWMGIRGRTGAIAADHGAAPLVTPVPKLWTFFVLLQILPVSLTQALFMIALLLVPPPSSQVRSEQVGQGRGSVKGSSAAGGDEVGEDESRPKAVVLLGRPGYWITPGLMYIFILVDAPSPDRKHWLIAMILLARALLFVPLILPFARLRMGAGGSQTGANGAPSSVIATPKSKGKVKRDGTSRKDEKKEGDGLAGDEPVRKELSADEIIDKASPMQLVDLPLALLALSAWAVAHQAYWTIQAAGDQGVSLIRQAVSEHAAVSALGYDFVIAAFVFLVWQLWGKTLQGGSNEVR